MYWATVCSCSMHVLCIYNCHAYKIIYLHYVLEVLRKLTSSDVERLPAIKMYSSNIIDVQYLCKSFVGKSSIKKSGTGVPQA